MDFLLFSKGFHLPKIVSDRECPFNACFMNDFFFFSIHLVAPTNSRPIFSIYKVEQ